MDNRSEETLRSRALKTGRGDKRFQGQSHNTIGIDIERQGMDGTLEDAPPVSTHHWFPGYRLGKEGTGLRFVLDHLDSLKFIPKEPRFSTPDEGYSIFLCIMVGGERYAIQIPCYRPRAKRQIFRTKLDLTNGRKKIHQYGVILPAETVCESDFMIYYKLRQICFEHQGNWKRWVPFYGIVDVREVKIVLTSARKITGLLPVNIQSLDVEKIRQEADNMVASQDPEDRCWAQYHNQSCQGVMDFYNEPCIEVQIEEAQKRKEYLLDLPLLKEYMQDPISATAHTKDGRSTLEGLAQESMVIDNTKLENAKRTDKLPAIEVVLGWQTRRLRSCLPRVWLVLALIWIVVVVFGVTLGDWSLSVGLGQLVAASVAILFAAVKL
ncbi:hypothetical protein M3J09_000125 [Ascochyta lentis]